MVIPVMILSQYFSSHLSDLTFAFSLFIVLLVLVLLYKCFDDGDVFIVILSLHVGSIVLYIPPQVGGICIYISPLPPKRNYRIVIKNYRIERTVEVKW